MSDEKFIFKAQNDPDLGAPSGPCIVTGDPRRYYHGYFENSLQERFVYVHDRQAGQGVLYGDDIGWDEGVEVARGVSPIGTIGGIVLGSDEAAWLRTCWTAATGKPSGAGEGFLARLAESLAEAAEEDPTTGEALEKLAEKIVRKHTGQ